MAYSSAQIIFEAANRHDLTTELFQTPESSLLVLSWQGKTEYLRDTLSHTDSALGMALTANKALTRYILAKENVPLPKGGVISSKKELTMLVRSLTFPVVLKPIGGKKGQGVVMNISTISALKRAYQQASKPSVLIEEQVPGKDFRVLMIDNAVVAATQRIPAHVVGGGNRTIAQLIDQKNLVLSYPIQVDEDLLSKQRHTLTTVPTKGKKIWLRANANLSTGGEAEDATDQVSSENKSLFAKIAKLFRIKVLGIDVISPDLQVPLAENGGVILEVNSLPGLNLHHYPNKGKPRDVASLILYSLFPKLPRKT